MWVDGWVSGKERGLAREGEPTPVAPEQGHAFFSALWMLDRLPVA